MLLALIVIPLVGALVVAMSPARQAKWLGLWWSLIALGAAAFAAMQFRWLPGEGADARQSGVFAVPPFQFQGEWTWIDSLGIRLSVGVDSVSMLLILLTALLGPICMAGSFSGITERRKLYYGSLLVLQAAMTGVFASRDLILFYLCFEFTLAPMFLLISQWGGSNRKRAGIKFFVYTFTGSILTLAGLVYVAWRTSLVHGQWTFEIAALEEVAARLPLQQQAWVLAALLAGFAVKVPLFPVHTWLPLAHTEAPTAGSVILAGVLLKLGTYGLYRFALPFAPMAMMEWAPAIAVVAIIGIIYTGLICWVQRDVKKLVAYSSVSHLGFCVLGLAALNGLGAGGSVMYMINHGLSTGALFLCVGMMYERYHTRMMDEVGGLASRMPVWAMFMVFFTLASVGLPGLNGFVSEFLCLMGAFQSGAGFGEGSTGGRLGPWYGAVAATGMIISAIYLLYMVGKLVFGPLREPSGHENGHAGAHEAAHALPADLSMREIAVLTPLAIACLWLGVYPTPVLRSLEPSIQRIDVIVNPEVYGGRTLAATPVDAVSAVEAPGISGGREAAR